MSTRPILQSRPDGTCPTALDSEPDAGPPAGGQPTATPASDPAGPRAHAQGTSDGFDAEVALDRRTGVAGTEGEFFSGSARKSRDEFTVEGAVARTQGEGRFVTMSAEALAFKASSGTVNPDGSVGRYVALGTTVVGVETTIKLGGNSVTAGLSAGVGVEMGIGTRDFDKDNRPEFCARVSALVLTLGLCLESPF